MPYGGDNSEHIAPLNAGFCFAVSTGAQNPELARAFVTFATSPEYHLNLLTTTGSGIDPTRVSALNSTEYEAVRAASAGGSVGVAQRRVRLADDSGVPRPDANPRR